MAQSFSSTDVEKPISVAGFDALVFTLFSFAALTTIVRVYLWTFILRSGVLDNALITIGTLLSFVITMLGHYGVVEMNYLSRILSPSSVDSSGDSGMGFLDRYNQLYRYGKIASLIYLITLPVVKCAILAFYRKIVVSKKSLYFLYVVAFVIVGQGVGNFTASLVTGIRSKTIWNILEGDSEDPMNTTHQIINSCFQIFFDLILLAIPIPILRRLKIRKSAKVGLVIVYILSFVSLAASIVRLHTVIIFFHSAALSSGALVAKYTYWTMIEVNTAIFCANLPALSSLLRMVVGYIKSSKQKRTSRERAQTIPAQRDSEKITPFSKLYSSRFWPSSMRSTNVDTTTDLEGSKKNLAASSVTSLPV